MSREQRSAIAISVLAGSGPQKILDKARMGCLPDHRPIICQGFGQVRLQRHYVLIDCGRIGKVEAATCEASGNRIQRYKVSTVCMERLHRASAPLPSFHLGQAYDFSSLIRWAMVLAGGSSGTGDHGNDVVSINIRDLAKSYLESLSLRMAVLSPPSRPARPRWLPM